MSDLKSREAFYLDTLRDILGRYFNNADLALIDDIKAEIEWFDVKAGNYLFRQGDSSADIFFLLYGRMRAIKAGSNGGTEVLGDIARGETIGEMALFTGEPRSADVIAVRNSSLARLPRAAFERLMSKAPSVAMKTVQLVIDRFRRRETMLKTPAAPATICILPISPGIDAREFAALLAAHFDDPCSILSADDVNWPDNVAQRQARWRQLLFRSTQSVHTPERLLFVGDPNERAWTEACLQEADEILLLGDGDGEPVAISDIEQSLLLAQDICPLAQQTLVLLHSQPKLSPRGTAGWVQSRCLSRHVHVRPHLTADIRRLARILCGKAVGLVLSGGGARALAHLGVIKALTEHGIEADFVGGTSMGAVMAGWYAMEVRGDTLMQAGARAFGQNPSGDYNYLPVISLVRGDRTSAIIAQEIHEVARHEIDIGDCWRNMFCVASDYTAAREAILRDGPLSRAIMASVSIPGIFPPQIINGHVMFDGGTFNNFPVDVMESMGVGKIIGVDMLARTPEPVKLDSLPAPFAVAMDRFRSTQARRYRVPLIGETLLTATFIAAESKQRQMRSRTSLYIRPEVEGISILDWKKLPMAVEAGYAATKAALAALSNEQLQQYM